MTDLIVELGMAKRAADTPEPTFQQQFGILSNAMIIDKFPNLADYRVAFQLIQKNDQNTKALGVSVNRLDKQFIHIPAFFNNGKIKTGDMMYVPSIDMFRPLSDAWLAEVRGMELGDTGETVAAQNVTASSPGSVRVKQSTDPIVKTASLHSVAKDTAPLDIFGTALKMGKKASSYMMDKLNNDRQFLSNVLKFYDAAHIVQFGKKASVMFDQQPQQPKYQLITPLDKRASQLTEQQRQLLFQQGFFIRTNPMYKQASQQPAATVLDASRIQNLKDQFIVANDSCVAQLMDINGNLHKALVITPDTFMKGPAVDLYPGSCQNTLRGTKRRIFLVQQNKTNYAETSPQVLLLKSSIQCPCQNIEKYSTKLTSQVQQIPYGSIIYSAGRFFHVSRSLTKSPNVATWTQCYGCCSSCDQDFLSISLVDDDQLKSPLIGRTAIQLPKDSRIIFPSGYRTTGICSTDQDQRKSTQGLQARFCTPQTLVQVIDRYKNKHYKRVKVYTQGTQYIITGQQQDSAPLQTKQAALHIVNSFGVHPKDARQMLKRAMLGADYNHPRRLTFYISKTAADNTVQDMQWQRSNVSSTEVSNKLRPDVQNIDLDQFAQNPQQLMQAIQTAADQGIKQVFDVTALKLLAQASDISQHIGDYVSDFLKSLDKLCRMLFMLYQHSDTMQQKYGTLKMKSLQQSIKNSLDSLSQLTVFLKLRGFGGTDLDGYVQGNALIGGQML